MGKKSKLKKIRKELRGEEIKDRQNDSTQFVRELQHRGYQLKQIQRSPELPKQNIEPTI